MDGEDIIHQFESGLISAESFHHAGHVQLAFAYLTKYPVLQALEKFVVALRRFATAQGKTRLYNETITFAYFFLIRERMARRSVSDWNEFCLQNPDLLTWRDGILNRYYDRATLQSDLARTVFVFPDKLS